MQERKKDEALPLSARFNNTKRKVVGRTLSDIKTMNKKYDEKGEKDTRFWNPKPDERDEVTTFYLRFMPPKDFETSKIELLLIYKHWFQLQNKNWVVTPCPNTIGEDCPICETRSDLYSNKENPDSKTLADSIKKNRICVANVLILHDPVEPENNGKVFLWEFGKAITELIETKMNPEKDKEEIKYNVFDPFESGILKLKVKYDKTPIQQGASKETKSVKTKNYSGSTFIDPQGYNEQQKSWVITEERFEKLIDKCYSLENYLVELNVPSYEKCKEYFESKLNTGKKTSSLTASMMNSSSSVVDKKNKEIVDEEMEEIAAGMPEDIKEALESADKDLKKKMVDLPPANEMTRSDDEHEDDIFS